MINNQLKGAAGVQINLVDKSGRPRKTSIPYRIGLVGWTPKGPSNIPTVVSSETELYSLFGTPKGFPVDQVYLLHNAKVLLNAGAEVVVVRTVQANDPELLNYGVYSTTENPSITSNDASVTNISYNMSDVVVDGKNSKLKPSDAVNSPFTAFVKYPGFKGYCISVDSFETITTNTVAGDDYVYGDVAHTLNAVSGTIHNNSERATLKSYIEGLGLYSDYYVEYDNTALTRMLRVDVDGTYYPQSNGTYSTTPQGSTKYSIVSGAAQNTDIKVYSPDTSNTVLFPTPSGKMYGDVYKNGKFYRCNGNSLYQYITNFDSSFVENEDLNRVIDSLVVIRLYENINSTSPIESPIYATINEYVSESGDQLEISYAKSNLLTFKVNASYSGASVQNKKVSKTLLEGGAERGHARVASALVSAWRMFNDLTNVEVSLLVDGGSSINGFGVDRENDGIESSNLSIIEAMLETATARMDSPCIIDVPKHSSVKTLIERFKKYPSVSTNTMSVFWGNAQDGRQIINDTFNKKQIECARSVFKGATAYSVISTSYPWQTQWGPNRGLIGSPSLGTLNPRKFPDEVGLLSQARINPSRLTSTGEYFWDDYTLMSKSSVLQRWHAVCFLANLNKRYRRMLEPYVAELNTPALRKSIWTMLNEDLDYIKNHTDPAGLYNYYVICDETNNTPENIDEGIVNVDVGLEIVRDARVINLTNTLYRTGGIIESGIKI